MSRMVWIGLGLVVIAVLLVALGMGRRPGPDAPVGEPAGSPVPLDSTMKLESPAFTHEGSIPAQYTCDGNDISPPLTVAGVPAGAKSLALIVDDPDAPAGTWVHWVVYDIPADVTAIESGQTPTGAREGSTSYGRTGYGGPCPPSGTHRYYFRLYALDTALGLTGTPDADALRQSLAGHIIAEAELMGRYARAR